MAITRRSLRSTHSSRFVAVEIPSSSTTTPLTPTGRRRRPPRRQQQRRDSSTPTQPPPITISMSPSVPSINPQTLSVGARARLGEVWFVVIERQRRIHGRMVRTRMWARDVNNQQAEPSFLRGYKSSMSLTQRRQFLTRLVRTHGAGPVFNKLKQLAVYNSRKPAGVVMWDDVKWIGDQLPTLDCPPERPNFSRKSNRCIQGQGQGLGNQASSSFEPQVGQNRNSTATTDLALFGIQSLSQDRQVGQRPYQEDQWVEIFLARFFAAVILDGHGGSQCALFVSSQLEPVLREYMTVDLPMTQVSNKLQQVVTEIQRRWGVYSQSHGQNTSGTTITGILRDRQHLEKVWIFNLGDSTSMLYRIPSTTSTTRTPMLLFQTRPHDLGRARQTQLRRLDTSRAIQISRDRANINRLVGDGIMLNLSGAMGDLYMPGISDMLIRTLDVEELTFHQTSARVIVMSDGISDDFNAATLMRLNKSNASELVQHVIDHGEKGDNVSAIILDIEFP